MTLDNMTGITKGSYTGGDLFCKSQLITCNRVKECNGVCPFEDALQHADKTQTMNEQHNVDHDRETIDHAPTIEDVQGWIPVSERLPEKDDLVLVTVWNDVVTAWRNRYGGWESAEDMYEKGDVTAWMPLPEPYRKDGEA